MKKELRLQDYIDLVLRRRWLILAAVLGVMTATIVFSFTRPYIYESMATFMLESRDFSFAETGMAYKQQTKPLEYFQALLKSREFIEKMNAAMKVEIEALRSAQQITKPVDLQDMVKTGVVLKTGTYEDLIELSAKATHPRLAFALARNATDLLKGRSMSLDQEEYRNTVQFIEEQKTVAQEKLEQAERDLQQFKDTNKITQSELEGGAAAELVKLENELTQIQTQKELAQSNLDAYENKLRMLQKNIGVPTASEPERAQTLRDDITRLEKMKDILVRQSGTSPAETAKLDAQIDAKKKELVALIVGDTQFSGAETNKDLSQIKTIQENRITEELNVYVLTNREKYYQALIVDFRKNHPNIVENAILFIRLSRAKTVAENLYNFLLEKGEEAKIRAASTSGGIRIVDAPMLPEAPMSRGTVRNLLLGLILGLGLGFGAALTAEYLDNSIQNHEQITEAFNIPVMGTIPAFSDIPKRIRRRKASHGHGPTRRPELTPTDGKGPLITIMSPKSPAVEAYRTLRANLQFASVDTAIKSMLVTSPSPGEGKSVTSANLAIAFALLGDKVLLVDCDLRKPVVHNLFPVQKTPGLSNCLVEKMPLKAVIQESGVQNLNILSAGTMPPNPAEMLASKGMQHLMEELKREFNLVVFDTPPVLPVADAVMLASRTDGVLLVFKHQQTRMDLAAMALQSLSRGSGRMLGAVLNFTRVQRGYGYYYRYYAKEYYSH